MIILYSCDECFQIIRDLDLFQNYFVLFEITRKIVENKVWSIVFPYLIIDPRIYPGHYFVSNVYNMFCEFYVTFFAALHHLTTFYFLIFLSIFWKIFLYFIKFSTFIVDLIECFVNFTTFSLVSTFLSIFKTKCVCMLWHFFAILQLHIQ